MDKIRTALSHIGLACLLLAGAPSQAADAGPFSGGPSTAPAPQAPAKPIAAMPGATPAGQAALKGGESPVTWPSADPRGNPPSGGAQAGSDAPFVMAISTNPTKRKAFVGPRNSYSAGRWVIAGDPIPGRDSGVVVKVCGGGLSLSTGEFIGAGESIPAEAPTASRKGSPRC